MASPRHCLRTADAGLIPAVNMDTGFGNLLDEATRLQVLERTRGVLGGRPFVAGTFVADRPGAAFDLEGYIRTAEPIVQCNGTPVIFQSYGLTGLPAERLIEAYEEIGRRCGPFIAFELSTAFAPFGKIYSLETYRGLMEVKACQGAKHSSLHRLPEWERIRLRDIVRPDFRVYTGNDLAIDMVAYGSDYLLGLSTFARTCSPGAIGSGRRAIPRFTSSTMRCSISASWLFAHPYRPTSTRPRCS